MASNYKLNLQCVLDTTQVKQELQKLRQMQNQILGNNGGTSANYVSQGSKTGLGNISGLNSTLSRLTNSINQLNATINKLNQLNTRNNNVQQAYTQIGRHNLPIFGSNQQTISNVSLAMSQERIRKHYEDFLFEQDKNRVRYARKLRNRDLTNSQQLKIIWEADAAENKIIEKYVGYTEAESSAVRKYNANNNNQKVGSGISPEQKRMLGGLAFGAGLNAISMGLEASGNTTAANIASNIGTIGSYSVMGSAAGPIGAGIGAAVGIIQVGAEQIVAAFKEASDAATNMAKRIEQARTFDQAKRDIETASADAIALKGNDVDYFVEQRKKYNSQIRYDQRYQDVFKKTYGSLEEFERETNKLEQEGYDGVNDQNLLKRVEERKRIADRYKESVARLQKNQSRVQQYSSTIESLTNRKDSISESFDKFYAEKSINSLLNGDNRSKVEKYKIQLENYLKKQKEIFEGYRKDGFRSKNSEKVLEDIQLTEGRLDKINSWLDNYDKNENQRIERYNKQIENEESAIGRYSEGKYLDRIVKKGDVNVVRMAALSHKQSRDTAFDLYKNSLYEASFATDSKTKEELLDKANKYKSDWQYSSGIFDNLNQSLGQLLVAPLQDALSKLRAPDMQNVNSLAGQGVMINRADDASRTESLLDYQREQTNLQRQIKDLL